MLKIGTKVNDFVLNDSKGQPHHLKDYQGKKIVIYFYPKDGTPGCTAQACAFRDQYEGFKQKDIVVIGISRDTVKSHQKFVKNNDLPFILLSDEGLNIAEMFGVKVEKSMFGKNYFTNTRTTFILDENQIITHVYEKASPTENASDILKALS